MHKLYATCIIHYLPLESWEELASPPKPKKGDRFQRRFYVNVLEPDEREYVSDSITCGQRMFEAVVKRHHNARFVILMQWCKDINTDHEWVDRWAIFSDGGYKGLELLPCSAKILKSIVPDTR